MTNYILFFEILLKVLIGVFIIGIVVPSLLYVYIRIVAYAIYEGISMGKLKEVERMMKQIEKYGDKIKEIQNEKQT